MKSQIWTYKGVNIDRAMPNSSGIRWYSLSPVGGIVLRADTKAAMRRLITEHLARRLS